MCYTSNERKKEVKKKQVPDNELNGLQAKVETMHHGPECMSKDK